MEIVKLITGIGVLLNTLGTVLVFAYGISPLINKDGKVFLFNKKEHSERQMNKVYFERRAKTGLIMCVLGNLLQFISLIAF